MSFNLRKVDDISFLEINCPLDESKEVKFKDFTEKIFVSNTKAYVLDFKNCNYINSCSIGIIFSCIREIHENNKMIMLLNVGENLEKWFKEIKLDTVVKFCKSEKECFDLLNK